MTDGARTVGEVFTDIAGNLERLARAELRLATTGALERVKATVLGAALIAVGALLWFLTVGLFMWGAVTQLSDMMQPWQAMWVVAGSTGLLGAAVLTVGLRAFREPAHTL